jgi:hypothetical protein
MGVERKGKVPQFNLSLVDIAMEKMMREIGEFGVKFATERHEFDNQTFNLQDSYGYAVYNNGAMVGNPVMFDKNATERIEYKGESLSGHEEGVKALNSANVPESGWTVVVVAGMYYATWVEEVWGLDVLTNSELSANIFTEKLLKEAKWESILKS